MEDTRSDNPYVLSSSGIQKISNFIDVPDEAGQIIADFESTMRGTGTTAKITGARWEVFMSGVRSEPFRAYVETHSHATVMQGFLEKLKESLEHVARENSGILSQDIVALVGGGYMQVPHVDLKPGQVQVIVALTDTIPTLVYNPTAEQTSMEQVEECIGVNPANYADDPRLQPLTQGGAPLVLPVARVYASMVPACDNFNAGDAVQIKDGIVHAGPKCESKSGMPRIVVFSTYSLQDVNHYNVDYQFNLWTWALHPMVPPKIVQTRFLEVCNYARQHDMDVTPWTCYPGVHAIACQLLCEKPDLDDDNIENMVSIWRTGDVPKEK